MFWIGKTIYLAACTLQIWQEEKWEKTSKAAQGWALTMKGLSLNLQKCDNIIVDPWNHNVGNDTFVVKKY